MQPDSAMGADPPGPALVYMPAPARPKIYDRYPEKQSVNLGITQISIGILCMIFNSVCLGVRDYSGLGGVGHGYWCGIMFLITGVFGITAGKKKTKCQIVTFMVLCIISAVMTTALLVVGIIGAVTTDPIKCHYEYNYGYYYNNGYPSYHWVCDTMPSYKVIVAMESCLAICGFIEVIVAVWGSALCCGSGVCSCSSPAMVVPAAGYYPHTGQVIYISHTQGGPYIYAPKPTFSYHQGMMSSGYSQPGWPNPTTNIDQTDGQAPPAYTANLAQPIWMIPSATTNPGPAAAQAPFTDPVQNQAKEVV